MPVSNPNLILQIKSAPGASNLFSPTEKKLLSDISV